MRIDELVIKIRGEEKIQKNIGRIFRKHNIIEYKSPDDYLTINDFYKVYGYCCFYQSDTEHVCEIKPEELTITLFVIIILWKCSGIYKSFANCK